MFVNIYIKDANVAQALSSFIKVGGTLENPQIALHT